MKHELNCTPKAYPKPNLGNLYTWWRRLLMIALFVIGFIYALPSFYGDAPAIVISQIDKPDSFIQQLDPWLEKSGIPHKTASAEGSQVTLFFAQPDDQLQAYDILRPWLKTTHPEAKAALNLVSTAPTWLTKVGAQPVHLGLDLRGGVHFLLQIDTQALMQHRADSLLSDLATYLREQHVLYQKIIKTPEGILVAFPSADNAERARQALINSSFSYSIKKQDATSWIIRRSDSAHEQAIDYAMSQTIETLGKRINELGLSEAIVQRQGRDQISIDLPGIQDPSRARELLGKTATLRFQLADSRADARAMTNDTAPRGSHLYQDENGRPVLLHDEIILRGDAITYASAVTREGRPTVNIQLDGASEHTFYQITSQHVGDPLAVVYVDYTQETSPDGQISMVAQEKVISVATINSALGGNFDITGAFTPSYAQNLALLLRSGALAAPVNIIEESTVGPSLGQRNIDRGMLSMAVGSLLVFVFMACYYRVFGLIANLALILNVLLILSCLSWVGATLTLPGIAAIVLTVGIAVDANVLIYERIREEIRRGYKPQVCIRSGYERAFSTIVDANMTSLIVAIILFGIGSGTVKGFAVSLVIGLLISMLTAITITRIAVDWLYPHNRPLSIGINTQEPV